MLGLLRNAPWSRLTRDRWRGPWRVPWNLGMLGWRRGPWLTAWHRAMGRRLAGSYADGEAFEAWAHRPPQKIGALENLARKTPTWRK